MPLELSAFVSHILYIFAIPVQAKLLLIELYVFLPASKSTSLPGLQKQRDLPSPVKTASTVMCVIKVQNKEECKEVGQTNQNRAI